MGKRSRGISGRGGVGDEGEKSVCRRAERKRASAAAGAAPFPLAPPHDPLSRRSGFRSLFKDKATIGGGAAGARSTQPARRGGGGGGHGAGGSWSSAGRGL